MKNYLASNYKISLSEIYSGRSTAALLLLIGLLFFCSAIAAAHPHSGELPLPVRVVLSKINPLLVEKQYDQAIEVLLKFQARSNAKFTPGRHDAKGYHHPEIYYTLGNCYLLKDAYESAAEAFDKAVKGDDNHTYAWLNLAKAYYELERYAQAAHAFGRGYESAEEKNPEHLYFSAAAYLMAEEYLRSIDIFERLFAVHPESVKLEWKEHLVHALLAVDQPRKALPHIRQLAMEYTGDKQIRWQEILLHQYVQLDMQRDALNYARALTSNAPSVAKWWKALAHIQLNQNHYENALAALTVYSFLIPLSLEEKKLLADLNLQLGIPVKAAPTYENYLKEKTDKEILQHLVIAYRQLGKTQCAIDCLDRFSALETDPDLMLLKGELLYALKKYDQAADLYRKAASKEGKHTGRAWLMAGYAAWQVNDISASKSAFVKAAAYKREKTAANTALKQLTTLTVENASNKQIQKKYDHEGMASSEI